jgi:hypothetical protein
VRERALGGREEGARAFIERGRGEGVSGGERAQRLAINAINAADINSALSERSGGGRGGAVATVSGSGRQMGADVEGRAKAREQSGGTGGGGGGGRRGEGPRWAPPVGERERTDGGTRLGL